MEGENSTGNFENEDDGSNIANVEAEVKIRESKSDTHALQDTSKMSSSQHANSAEVFLLFIPLTWYIRMISSIIIHHFTFICFKDKYGQKLRTYSC